MISGGPFVRHRHWSLSLIGWGFAFTLLLSACTAPIRPTTQPTDPPLADLPLADLQTSQLADLHQAAYNYARYLALAPDDLLGLKQLAEVCTTLEEAGVEDESCHQAAEQMVRSSQFAIPSSPAAVLQKALEARTDDRRIVAELLGVPVEDVELGPNSAENGGFETWVDGTPEWWVWSDMATGSLRNVGVFVGGADRLDAYSDNAARVNGLWLQFREDKEPGRCGYWQWDKEQHDLRSITLTVSVPYLLGFDYRTRGLPDGASTVWTSYEPEVLFAGDHRLPATDGEWRRFIAVGWNRANDESAIRPLVRSFAPGCVEFDNVQVRPIWLSEKTGVTVGETQFRVIGEGN